MIDAAIANQFAEPRRLHPLTMFYQGIVRMPGVVLAIYFSARNGEFWVFVIVTTLAILIGIPGIILRYLYFTFHVTEDEVIVDSGVFSRRSRNIPIERIQNIEMRQNFLQRIFGIAQVQLETAGGQNTEGVFEFISTSDAEALRLLIREYQAELEPEDAESQTLESLDPDVAAESSELSAATSAIQTETDSPELNSANDVDSRSGSEGAPAAADYTSADHAQPSRKRVSIDRGERVLYEMPKRTLLLYGMFRFSFWFLAAAFTIGQYTGFSPEEIFESGAERQLLELQSNDTFTLWLFGLGLAIGLLLLSWVSGILFTVNQYHGFRLALERGKLLKQHGLLAVSKATIPLRKVQSMVMRSNPLMRKFGYAGLEVQTAGFGADKRGPEVAVPMASKEKTLELLREVMRVNVPETFTSISRKAIRRAFVRLLVFWSIVTFALSFAMEYYVVWLALLLPLLYYIALLRWRYRGYSIQPDNAFIRHGFWWRRVSVIPLRKIQTLSLYQSFFQRRLGLASIYIDTAGSGGVYDARIDDVAIEDAERILDELRTAFNAAHSGNAPQPGPSSAQLQDEAGALKTDKNAPPLSGEE